MFLRGFQGKKNGGKGGDRTHDTRIFSPRIVLQLQVFTNMCSKIVVTLEISWYNSDLLKLC